jgi:hypothetical protein
MFSDPHVRDATRAYTLIERHYTLNPTDAPYAVISYLLLIHEMRHYDPSLNPGMKLYTKTDTIDAFTNGHIYDPFKCIHTDHRVRKRNQASRRFLVYAESIDFWTNPEYSYAAMFIGLLDRRIRHCIKNPEKSGMEKHMAYITLMKRLSQEAYVVAKGKEAPQLREFLKLMDETVTKDFALVRSIQTTDEPKNISPILK